MKKAKVPTLTAKLWTALLATVSTFGLLEAALAAPAQEPLFLTSHVEPNIMYIMDDSGSMQFEVMPEEEFVVTINNGWWGVNQYTMYYVFPPVSNVYGSGNYTAYVPTVDNNVFNYRARSPQVNTLYYNPSVTYTPWTRADGSQYPNASPEAALHHPENTQRGYRNLTAYNNNTNTGHPYIRSQIYRWFSCTTFTSCSQSDGSKTFWPATYYWYDGTNKWDGTNYAKTEIKPGVNRYTGHGREKRTDCAAQNSCTYREEIQNFANWYTYYRSRTLAARAGVGKAFAQQGANMRIGYGAINQNEHIVDGVRTKTIIKGVRSFEGSDKEDFFKLLYESDVPAAGTPLRSALDDAGQYFSRADNKGPWGARPGSDDSAAHLECRQSYTVLMTDGYWSGDSADTGGATRNNDKSAGSRITGPNEQEYTFAADTAPFADSYSDTLADVSMYYWKNDLRPNLDNRVPTSGFNPAFWQHMVTFGVGLGVSGSVDPSDAFDAIESGTSISWPNPTVSNPAKIDDLLHASVNSRGGFFSAGDPETFASELSSVLRNIIGRVTGSATSVAANSTRLSEGSFVYQARFNSQDWSGEILAYEFDNTGEIAGDPISTNDTLRSDVINSDTRKIYTYNGSDRIPFEWDRLTADQQLSLQDGDSESIGRARVRWLRGDVVSGLRTRESVDGKELLLGDIVNSSPVYLGGADMRYDRLPSDEATQYRNYLMSKRQETPRIFVGANDGMLHAFDAATLKEEFAYIPSSVYPKLADITRADYGRDGVGNPHQYLVDGQMAVGDAYIDGVWRSILVGTLGAGGKGVYALDVTDSDSPPKVLFELNSDDYPTLGFITGRPYIVPLKDDDGVRWAAVFANGYNSGATGLFWVDLNNPSDVNFIEASAPGQGLSTPALLPNALGVVEAAYAGDLDGNLWKFNLSYDNEADWEEQKLFTAKSADSKVQPITATPTLGINQQKAGGAIMVYFGTGSYLYQADNTTGIPRQTIYAIADVGETISRNDLFKKAVIESAGSRTIDEGTEDWETNDGWYLDLPTSGERSVAKPLLLYDKLILTTLIPSVTACDHGGSSWVMEVSAVGDKFTDLDLLPENQRHNSLVLGNLGIGTFDPNPPGGPGEPGDGGDGSGDDGEFPDPPPPPGDCKNGGIPARIYAVLSDGSLEGQNVCLPPTAFGRMSWRQLQ